MLYRVAEASLAQPDGTVREVVYKVIGEQRLKDIVKEYKAGGTAYHAQVHTVMRASYQKHYRQVIPLLLSLLDIRSNNEVHRPVIQALSVVKRYARTSLVHYPLDEEVPMEGVVKPGFRELVEEKDAQGELRINRINYELSVLEALREKLRCRELWVAGAGKYGNPEDDLPQDFDEQRASYYQALSLPQDADQFLDTLQAEMREALAAFNRSLPQEKVRILDRGGGWISLSPLEPQEEPRNLGRLKGEIGRRWPMTSLLDILKEADLRLDFTQHFKSPGTREVLDREVLRKRLLLSLYAMGTNTGLKRVSVGEHGEAYQDLLYVRRRYIQKDQLRAAIADVANAIFRVRREDIWGEATTTCASDSKQFGSWDHNLLTEWHLRYGGKGIMIYWHVEKHAVCIYSQLKTVSSSEVAAMIQGVMRHCTDMQVQKQKGSWSSSISRRNRKAADGANPCDAANMGQGMDEACTERVARLLLPPGKHHVPLKVTLGESTHYFINVCQQGIKRRNQLCCRGRPGQLGRPAIQGIVLQVPVLPRCNEGIAQQNNARMHGHLRNRPVIDERGVIVQLFGAEIFQRVMEPPFQAAIRRRDKCLGLHVNMFLSLSSLSSPDVSRRLPFSRSHGRIHLSANARNERWQGFDILQRGTKIHYAGT